MPSSKNYKERGIASWYGTKFHEKHTSSGERYDMLAMTAAHRNLPLPTYLEVTNLENHKKIIVKVNDRGPFERSRILDLSYAAAKKLGMLGRGTAKVEIKAIDPLFYDKNTNNQIYFAKNKSQSIPKNTYHLADRNKMQDKNYNTIVPNNNNLAKSSSFYLQVGAFKNKLYAEKLQKQLIALVQSPVNIKPNKNNFYRVQIGPIKDARTVAHINKQLQSIGLNSRAT